MKKKLDFDEIFKRTIKGLDGKNYDCLCELVKGIFVICNNNKYGIINSKGRILAECRYDYVGCFYKHLLPVRCDGRYGFLNKDGKEIVKCKYEDFIFFNDCIKVKFNGKWKSMYLIF